MTREDRILLACVLLVLIAGAIALTILSENNHG